MIKALDTAATGMSAQETNVNTISNNIANVNTNGFKRERTEFEDLLYEQIREPGGRSGNNTNYNVGIGVGSGARVSAIKKEFAPGNPQVTGNPFDLMINGDGMFGIVQDNNQVSFTRDGAFSVDATGTLVTKSGYKVFPGITIPQNTTTVNISRDGKVEAFVKNQPEPVLAGNIPVFTFVNTAGLKSLGGNLFQSTSASGEPAQGIPGSDNFGVIEQGTIESSNVSVMNEMTNLIRAQRAYEMNSKVMNVADSMMQSVNNLK